MSKENKKTLEVYDMTASRYLENTIKGNNSNPEKARKKEEELKEFIRDAFSSIPKGSKVFEIGSADGENAKYLKELGFDVTPSDIADAFIKAIKENGLNPIKFNAIKNKFLEKYAGIFCWRVFVHFTKEDAMKVIKNTYDGLEKDGIFVFNAMNREVHDVDEEWLDLPGDKSMGEKRYYHYFKKEELDKMAIDTGYEIFDYQTEGGKDNNKWHIYTLKKKEK